jgi:hypothetical protein
VCLNSILISLLLRNSPNDLKLVLVDPKVVEFGDYQDLPHLATPVITNVKLASEALKWATLEMDRRYLAFQTARVRDLKTYNMKVKNDPTLKPLPRLVVVIEEFADLIMTCGNDVESSIQRITQMGRAAGIHLILATQRPTTDIVKGSIKTNIQCRIAFRVVDYTASTTILGQAGAEELLGRGDMLFKVEDLPTLSACPLVVYSETLKVKGALHIVPNGLLFKKGVREYDITMNTWDGVKTFFATKGGDIPFDIFSASFYLLSRYEEYLPIKENFDSKGCFISEKSLAYKEGFLETPLVDVWALKLEEKLKSLFPNYTSSIDRRFRFLPIISVNTPYRYRTYSVLGNVLRLGKKVLERDWSELKKQLRVLLRIDQDPYCNVEKIVELHNRNSLRPLFAFRISNKKWYKRPVYFAYSTYKKVLCRNYQIALCISGVASNSVTQLKMEQKILSRIFRTRIRI